MTPKVLAALVVLGLGLSLGCASRQRAEAPPDAPPDAPPAEGAATEAQVQEAQDARAARTSSRPASYGELEVPGLDSPGGDRARRPF